DAQNVRLQINIDQKELTNMLVDPELDAQAIAAAGLRPDHVRRLRQLQLQASGPEALAVPEVARAIGLNDDQRRRVTALLSKGLNGAAAAVAKLDQLPQDEDLGRLVDIHAQTTSKCLARPTPAQPQTWRA